uniref:RanBD1 domain-containing protein n=1 Tax=Macrostomum lignano TaxID=282301 RepID=A0A1I8F3Y6_9PLAT
AGRRPRHKASGTCGLKGWRERCLQSRGGFAIVSAQSAEPQDLHASRECDAGRRWLHRDWCGRGAKVLQTEFYFGITMDRKHRGPVLIGSSQGGVKHESRSPRRIRGLIYLLCRSKEAGQYIVKDVRLVQSSDATLIEINPSLRTTRRRYCAWLKMNFDANSEFRQPEIFFTARLEPEDERDVRAEKAGLKLHLPGKKNWQKNQSAAWCNGAGHLSCSGGSPPNFADVAAGATSQI